MRAVCVGLEVRERGTISGKEDFPTSKRARTEGRGDREDSEEREEAADLPGNPEEKVGDDRPVG